MSAYTSKHTDKNLFGGRRNILVPVLIGLVLALAAALVLVLLLWRPWGVPEEPSSAVSVPAVTTTQPTQAHTLMVVTADVLNVRTGPGTDYDLQGTLTQGSEVQVLAQEGEWSRIQYNGTEAYVSSQYLTEASVFDTTTTTTTTTGTGKTTATTAASYDDRYIDEDGMLQFKTDGRYVQASSYASSDEIPWALRLVNDWNPMPLGYDTKLQMASISGAAGAKQVDARIMEDLKRMIEAGKEHNIGVQSAYRSASKQSELYWKQVNKWKPTYKDPIQLQTKAGEIVKRPGYSEHNVGLAVDLYGSGDYSLTSSFEKTPAYKWLIENCADYGFILRFPKGKESITGVIYESWHFRYVGDAAIAHEIMDIGLCLEEYLANNKK